MSIGSFSEWAYNEPNNKNKYETCVTLSTSTSEHKFSDENCHLDTFNYICDIR